MSRRVRAPLVLSIALLAGCGGSASYDMVIAISGGDLAQAVSIQLDVVRDGCERMPGSGFTPHPSEVVWPFVWPYGEEAPVIGNLVPATYGFYGRVRSARCQVHWAGCESKKIAEDGQGLIELVLDTVDGPACDPDFACDGNGVCYEVDEGA